MAEPTAQIEAEIDALLLLQGRSGLELDATPWSAEGPSPAVEEHAPRSPS